MTFVRRHKYKLLLFILLLFFSCAKSDNAILHEDEPGPWENTLSGSVYLAGCSFEAEACISDICFTIGPEETRVDSNWISSELLDYYFDFDYCPDKGFNQSLHLKDVPVSGIIGKVAFDSDISIIISNGENENIFSGKISGNLQDNMRHNMSYYRETGNKWSGDLLITWNDGVHDNYLHVNRLVTYINPE
jgi:hypothetical protein